MKIKYFSIYIIISILLSYLIGLGVRCGQVEARSESLDEVTQEEWRDILAQISHQKGADELGQIELLQLDTTIAHAKICPCQNIYLKASNTDAGDWFGYSMAIDGDTLVVGAYREDSNAQGVNGDQDNNDASDSGAAYVFVRSGGSWIQQAYLKASNTDSQDNFGYSVAIDGDTIVVGAHEEDSRTQGVNGDQDNNDVSSSGAAYVFVRTGGVWSQQAYLKASNTDLQDYFGYSVAIDGDTIVVGAPYEDSNAKGVDGDQDNNDAGSSGAAFVFVRNGETWSQQAYLKASNTESYDSFGFSVAIDGDTLVVSAVWEDSNAQGVNGDQDNNDANFSGAAYVFVRSSDTWSQQAYLKASNTEQVDYFGYSVAIDGDTIAVGAYDEDSSAQGVNGDQNNNDASGAGAAYAFVRSGSSWSQQAYLKASNTGPGDEFGNSVAIEGDMIVVGTHYEASNAQGVNGDQENNDASASGAAYVFVRSGESWSQKAYLKASNAERNDEFGISVAIGHMIVVGAFHESSIAQGVNGDQKNNDAGYAGAAYIFAMYCSYLPLVIR